MKSGTPSIIALVGLSGSGKSTAGRALARRLGWTLYDTDVLIEEAAGRRIPAIFADEGEAGFRVRETAALGFALERAPRIVATGAGIVLREENRVMLRERARVVWLDAPTNALIARLRAHDEERPLLAGDDPIGRLEALRATRAALYGETADVRVETAGLSADDVCAAVIRAIGAEGVNGVGADGTERPPVRS